VSASRIEQVRADFDEIAQLAESGASGQSCYDSFLLSLIPAAAARVLDVGCGMGRLTWAIAAGDREVVGVDLSSAMLERARASGKSSRVSFHQGDFLEMDFDGRLFECIVSAAALHHMPDDVALSRMVGLLRPGGRLIVHDLRRDTNLADALRGWSALAHDIFIRLIRTGRLRPPRKVRELWARHGATETYPSLQEMRTLVDRVLPGARLVNHWRWRYTILWDKPTQNPVEGALNDSRAR
jgi:ubiquinone/menaquinone biosynthesis C-methylase UbiE